MNDDNAPRLSPIQTRSHCGGRRGIPERERDRRRDEERGKCYDEILLERQRVAGEEDQSVPGWDQGA